MLTYSFYAVIAGAVLRVFSAVGISYISLRDSRNTRIPGFTPGPHARTNSVDQGNFDERGYPLAWTSHKM